MRVIGHDTDFDDTNHPYRDLPDEQKSFPGQLVTTVDGVNVSDRFEAFIHAPFKDDCAAARNDTSLAMQVTLKNGETVGRVLLLGDLAYPTLQRIFDQTKDPDRVAWDVLLAPHHCSRKVMYADEQGEEEFKQDIMNAFDDSRGERAYVIASSEPVPGSNQPGDNPPHAKAKARYQELGIEEFLCTQEYGDSNSPTPIVFVLTPGVGLELLEPAQTEETASLEKAIIFGVAAVAAGLAAAKVAPKVGGLLRAAIRRARGADAAPTRPVGFGRHQG